MHSGNDRGKDKKNTNTQAQESQKGQALNLDSSKCDWYNGPNKSLRDLLVKQQNGKSSKQASSSSKDTDVRR